MTNRDDIWKEALMDIALLQLELEEKGGPAEDAALFDHIIKLEKRLLKQFGLPDTLDFLKLVYFENPPRENDLTIRLKQIKDAATNYLLSDVTSELNILTEAKQKNLNPFNVLPRLNIRIHIYTIFIYDQILAREKDSVENVWRELQLSRDPEVLAFTGKIGLKHYDFEERIDYKKLLENKGLRYLDGFIDTQANFLKGHDF